MERFYLMWLGHPTAAWLGVAAVLLVVEIATGSGWLLWPAAAALIPALLCAFVLRDEVGLQWAVFAVTAIVLTWLGRRYLRPHPRAAGDINDARGAMIGQVGQVTSVSDHGQCRVFVGGKEWAAELGGDALPVAGARVQVTAVIGGARLQVRAAG